MPALTTPPTLDALADEPDRASSLPLEPTLALLARVCVVQSALTVRAVALALTPPAPVASDGLLDVAAASAKLGVSVSYLYRHARALPFTVRVGRGLRFSKTGIDEYIRQQHTRL